MPKRNFIEWLERRLEHANNREAFDSPQHEASNSGYKRAYLEVINHARHQFEKFVDRPEKERVKAAVEGAYRRGYYQGYSKATDDSKDKADEMYDHVIGELFSWRYFRHEGDGEPPPTI